MTNYKARLMFEVKTSKQPASHANIGHRSKTVAQRLL